jgi:acyl dehydratase
MTSGSTESLRSSAIHVGDELPAFELPVTSTVIVAGAIASRDFMPAHHDAEYARSQGAPDLFMNILTTNGYVARFVSDWAGPEARIRKIAIRLGAPAVPGKVLRFDGHVTGKREAGEECVVELAVRAANDLGDHATGSVVLDVPRG